MPASAYPVIFGADGRPVNALAAGNTVPAPSAADRRTLTRVVETNMIRGFSAILAAMPDPDEIVLHEGSDIYDKMRADDAVFAAEFQLMSRILGRPWDVRPPEHLAGDRFAVEVADYAKGVLTAMNTDAMTEHLYRALRHKHAGGQLVYRQEGSAYVPDYFLPERRTVFRFGERGVRLVNIDGIYREADPYKWQTHVNEPEPERPGGRSIFSRVYYPWKFKRTGWDLWVTAMDRFAVPSLAALLEMASEDDTKAAAVADLINEQLLNIASGSVGTLTNVKALQQIGGTKEIEGFDVFVELCDRSIYRGLLTTTLTVSEGREGAERGNTEVADETADQVAYHYGRHLAASITRQTVAYAVLLRFGEAARPVLPAFTFDFEEPISGERLLKFMEQGVPVSLNALYSSFGVPQPTDERDAFVSPKLTRTVSTGGVTARSRDGAAAIMATVRNLSPTRIRTRTANGLMDDLNIPDELREDARHEMRKILERDRVYSHYREERAKGATHEAAVDDVIEFHNSVRRPKLSREMCEQIILREQERRAQLSTIEVPSHLREEVEGKLCTLLRNEEICAAFEQLRADGKTWDEAIDALTKAWPLSRSSIKNIVLKHRRTE